MLVTIATNNPSITLGKQRYLRGEVYEVGERAGQAMVASGRFKAATLPPPDPLARQKERASALVDRLAAMGDGAMNRLERLLAALDGEAPAEEPTPAPAQDDGLDGLTVAALENLAEEEDIDLGGARRKADIIAAIRAGRG